MPENSIDLDTLNELKEIMEDDFAELVTTFTSDGQIQIDNLKLALDSSNTADVKRIAHTLKGSSSNFGAHPLAEICKTLEFKAAENSLDGAYELLENIKTEYKAVLKALAENF